MGKPRITYNGKTIDFLRAPSTIEPMQPADNNIVNWNYDHTVRETLVLAKRPVMSFEWPYLTLTSSPTAESPLDRPLIAQLAQFRIWAMDGGAWTFARDSEEAVSTTLNGAVSAGDKSVVVTSATGVRAGRRYVIRTPTAMEIVTVEAINGTTVMLDAALDADFATGVVFRSWLYWNASLVSATMRDLMPRVPDFAYQLEFEEVLA